MTESYGTKEDKFCIDCKYYWFDNYEETGNCDLTINTTGKYNTCDSFKWDEDITEME